MAVICPTVTAFSEHQYKEQVARLKPFTKRVHIDLMDGEFTPTVSPPLEKTWWPPEFNADIHLMYQEPMRYLEQLVALKPQLVIIHNEAYVHHMHFAGELHKHDIKAGLAILHDTPIEYAYQIMHSFDHVLIFSGDLGDTAARPTWGYWTKFIKSASTTPMRKSAGTAALMIKTPCN